MAESNVNSMDFEKMSSIPKPTGRIVQQNLAAMNDLNQMIAYVRTFFNESYATDLIPKAVNDLKTAVSFKSPDFPIVKFSKIELSHEYLTENGRVDIQELVNDFPHLHNAVRGMREHPSNAESWNCFRRFLFSLADVVESDHMFLPTSRMIEKRPELAVNREVWHSMRQFMEDSCNFVLGVISNVSAPEFKLANDPNTRSQLNELVFEIHSASNALKDSLA